VLENAVNDENGYEVAEDDPGRQPGRRPQAEELIREENKREKHSGDPFITEPARPTQARMDPAAHHVAHQHEGTRHAEKVSPQEQNKRQRATKVDPRQHSGQILRRQGGPEQSVQNHEDADQQQGDLQQRARMAPTQESPEDGETQQVEGRSLE
jgi:hypothetical protein